MKILLVYPRIPVAFKQRFDALSQENNTILYTSNIDYNAREGVLRRNAYITFFFYHISCYHECSENINKKAK